MCRCWGCGQVCDAAAEAGGEDSYSGCGDDEAEGRDAFDDDEGGGMVTFLAVMALYNEVMNLVRNIFTIVDPY